MAKAEQDFAAAVEHHRAGRLEQAIALYRALLRRATQPKAMQLLGAALNSLGRLDEAFPVLSEAVKYAPKDADSWVDYNAQFGRGNVADSVVAQLSKGARDVALMRTLGTNPQAMLEGWIDRLRTAAVNMRRVARAIRAKSSTEKTTTP